MLERKTQNGVDAWTMLMKLWWWLTWSVMISQLVGWSVGLDLEGEREEGWEGGSREGGWEEGLREGHQFPGHSTMYIHSQVCCDVHVWFCVIE